MDKKSAFRLSLVFALIYFFSTNGMASLPELAVRYLLKDVLRMTASQAAYFGAVTMLGWVIKPLWGIISDAFPICGYRRKSYLMVTAMISAAIWFALGQTQNYTAMFLLAMFTVASCAYAFNDVVCDGLMVETGKPHNLTGTFQAWQWGAVYCAGIITSLAGGWVAEHLSNQKIFTINAAFPLLVLVLVLFLVKEERRANYKKQTAASFAALKSASREKTLWLVALFLFFWNFSPSFGAPFFYYANDVLKFDKMFFGIAGAVASAASVVGSILFARFSQKIKIKQLLYVSILLGIGTTLFDLVYFTPFVLHNLWRARVVYLASQAILGVLGIFIFLTLLNLSAIICPKYSEGTVFAALMSIWNLGQAGSEIFGGWLFDQIGLPPLIIVSAVFTAFAWPLVKFLKLENAP